VKAVPCLAPTIITLAVIMRGAAEATLSIFFCRYVGLGVEGFALEASKPGFRYFRGSDGFRFLFTEESTTTTPSAPL